MPKIKIYKRDREMNMTNPTQSTPSDIILKQGKLMHSVGGIFKAFNGKSRTASFTKHFSCEHLSVSKNHHLTKQM